LFVKTQEKMNRTESCKYIFTCDCNHNALTEGADAAATYMG